MKKEKAKINCAIFQKQELLIEDITAKINRTKRVLEKAEFAEELLKEVGVLLSCPDYEEKSTACNNCRFIANVRDNTARLIIKAKKLT